MLLILTIGFFQAEKGPSYYFQPTYMAEENHDL